ncbi:hypothetical protein BDN71DRAFT_188670 [Pleurotus eryngii]|uniref:Uncharacterized protein n=1 Tax=Pleurotus eryngii TaxID=5323 RepID=A0A9P5ZRD7_PLEER|nr:hypothetical protein BDN71DRAFT_188670 [Pleurotus eryngii]
MCVLSASSDFEITGCQLNDVEGSQYFCINTFNNCYVATTPSTNGANQRSELGATPSAQQYGPVIPSASDPTIPRRYPRSQLRRRHGQLTSPGKSCACGRRHPTSNSFRGPERPMQGPNHRLDDPLVKHYLTCVVNIQYLLANKAATATLICVTVQTHATVHEAVRLLAAVHQDKRRSGQSRALETPNRKSHRIYGKFLVDLLYRERATYTKEDAIAALLVVSSVLFDGGTGDWKPWLRVVFNYLDRTFESHGGAGNALKTFAEDDSFIFVVKNAFWFDVIASVTQRQRAHYYGDINKLFHPSCTTTPPPLSMNDSIGCHNDIFWALNRASAFSSSTNPFRCYTSAFADTMKVLDTHAQGCRAPAPPYGQWSSWRFTSHMLCMATIVLLQSLGPDAASSLPIKRTTQEFLQSLRNVPTEERAQRHIVRSSVFSIFICGLFVTQQEDRQLLQHHLRQQSTDSIGNCTAIVKLLKSIWQDHDSVSQNGKWLAPVTWRGPLEDSSLLLV